MQEAFKGLSRVPESSNFMVLFFTHPQTHRHSVTGLGRGSVQELPSHYDGKIFRSSMAGGGNGTEFVSTNKLMGKVGYDS